MRKASLRRVHARVLVKYFRPETGALIRENYPFARKLRGVLQRCPDVLGSQLWIRLENFRRTLTGSELFAERGRRECESPQGKAFPS
jgi:hypothetical protein